MKKALVLVLVAMVFALSSCGLDTDAVEEVTEETVPEITETFKTDYLTDYSGFCSTVDHITEGSDGVYYYCFSRSVMSAFIMFDSESGTARYLCDDEDSFIFAYVSGDSVCYSSCGYDEWELTELGSVTGVSLGAYYDFSDNDIYFVSGSVLTGIDITNSEELLQIEIPDYEELWDADSISVEMHSGGNFFNHRHPFKYRQCNSTGLDSYCVRRHRRINSAQL